MKCRDRQLTVGDGRVGLKRLHPTHVEWPDTSSGPTPVSGHSTCRDQIDRVAQRLVAGQDEESGAEKLVWRLEHEYSGAGLSFGTLGNTDAAEAVETRRGGWTPRPRQTGRQTGGIARLPWSAYPHSHCNAAASAASVASTSSSVL